MYTSLLSVQAGGNWNDDSAAFLRTSSHVTGKNTILFVKYVISHSLFKLKTYG